MLTADEVKPLLLHEDPFIRRAATRYFADGRSDDPEILPRVLDACDRFGWESIALRGASFLKLTGPALDRILAVLGGTRDEMLRRSLNWMIRETPGDLAAARREAVLAAPGLESQVVRTIEVRAEVDALDPAAIWEELQDHCRRADAGGEDDFDDVRVEALVEALGRRDVPDEATIVGLLDDPNAWLVGEMVVLAGLRRIAAAVPALVNKIGEDSDFLFEEVQYALARINDPEAVRLILEAYPAATEDYRQTACWALENLRVPEAEDALLRLLETEADATLRTILCEGLCQMFSRRGVEAVARQIAAGYDTSLLTLEEDLLPVVDVLGVDLPGVDLDAWRAARDIDERQQEAIIAGMFRSEARAVRLEARGLDPWDRSFPEPGPVPAAATPGSVAPIRREAARVGRNDPCPCGSGKKFKKCCGKNA